MKFLYSIVLLSTLAAVATAAKFSGKYSDNAYPGKCVVDGAVLSPGESIQQYPGCGIIACGGNGFTSFSTCGVEIPPLNYKLGDFISPKAGYPDCCKRAYIPISEN